MPTHDYTKPPRTMPHTFARQEQEIKRLQAENKMFREKFALLEDGMSPHLAEVAETDTHFILLGTPGGHNCDEMGCGSVGHHVLLRVHKSEIPNMDALLEWSKAAYTRLSSLMTIGVSMTPDAVTKRLLENAPESVKGGENTETAQKATGTPNSTQDT
jgi:hypothetical protein